jgi:hypothetical protein
MNELGQRWAREGIALYCIGRRLGQMYGFDLKVCVFGRT